MADKVGIAPAAKGVTQERWEELTQEARRRAEAINNPQAAEEKDEENDAKGPALEADVEKILIGGELVTVSREKNEKQKEDDRVIINRVQNYYGSSAAASSDFFNKYRRERAREMERLEKMDKDWDEKNEILDFQKKRIENFQKDEERLEKKRAQRQRKKQKKQNNKGKQGSNQANQGEDKDPELSSDDSEDDNRRFKVRKVEDGVEAPVSSASSSSNTNAGNGTGIRAAQSASAEGSAPDVFADLAKAVEGNDKDGKQKANSEDHSTNSMFKRMNQQNIIIRDEEDF